MKGNLAPKSQILGLVCCGAVLMLQPILRAGASPIGPGGSIFTHTEPDPIGGTTLFSTNVSWASLYSFSGTLTSTVLAGDASNPFGLSALTFTYELTVDSTSTHSVSALTVGNFLNFQTDVSAQLPTNGIMPFYVTRSQESPGVGENIQFHFSPLPLMSAPEIAPGEYSTVLVVQTDATVWDFSIASVLNSSAAANILTLAPVTAVPEPSAAALGLLGLISAFHLRRTKPVQT